MGSSASMLLGCAGMRCMLWCGHQLLACIAGRQAGCQALCSVVTVKQPMQHATAIPSRVYPFSSDQGSQTGLGSTSTRLSDRPGTLSAVVFHTILLLLDGLKAVVCCSLATVLLHAHLWLCAVVCCMYSTLILTVPAV